MDPLRAWVAGGLSLAREGMALEQWSLRGQCPECQVKVALVAVCPKEVQA